jgi:undecaprenyl diphosphate synthase
MPDNNNNELIIPEHVAVILDGNGRWAKKRGLPRRLGHKAGCDNLEQMVEDSARIGLKYFTVYAFSTENWKRSKEEVDALMGFFLVYIKRLRERAMKNNIRVMMIGDRSRFSDELQELLNDTIAVTSVNTGMTFVMALNYGSRDEITRAVKKIGERVASGELKPEEITEDTISGSLDTAGMPDPDLLIRTSGELRLSNYMLWQLAYSEFYFSDVLWPDFHKEQLMEAIVEFNRRNRRFGGR